MPHLYAAFVHAADDCQPTFEPTDSKGCVRAALGDGAGVQLLVRPYVPHPHRLLFAGGGHHCASLKLGNRHSTNRIGLVADKRLDN